LQLFSRVLFYCEAICALWGENKKTQINERKKTAKKQKKKIQKCKSLDGVLLNACFKKRLPTQPHCVQYLAC
jgi:hypothetical protein